MIKGARIAEGRTAEIFAGGNGHILKLFRSWCPRTWAEQEFRIARAVKQAALPVPAVLDVVEVDGRTGIIYERIAGPSMLREFLSKPWRISRYACMLAELHAAMHGRQVSELPPQRLRLERKIQAAKLPAAVKGAALSALGALPPGDALCHGDFHPDNILMSPNGPIIIDWPDATRGNPLADVARTLLLFRLGELPPATPHRWLLDLGRTATYRIYLTRYVKLRGVTASDIDAWRLPVAAARASEEIAEERPRLTVFIDALLRGTA